MIFPKSADTRPSNPNFQLQNLAGQRGFVSHTRATFLMMKLPVSKGTKGHSYRLFQQPDWIKSRTCWSSTMTSLISGVQIAATFLGIVLASCKRCAIMFILRARKEPIGTLFDLPPVLVPVILAFKNKVSGMGGRIGHRGTNTCTCGLVTFARGS